MSRPDLPPPGNGASAVLDPNAVNELFENVVYGDGLPPMADEVDRCAQRRRLEAERRRAEMEQRSLDNAVRRALTEQNRQFFDSLVLSGPDRPQPPSHGIATSTDNSKSNQSNRIRIPFTAVDRSRIPRKTRQQWLDKFCTSAETVFPGAMIGIEHAVVLSLEQSVYQISKTATSYIGAWMNRIHAMKSSSSLNDFLSPNAKPIVVENPDPIQARPKPVEIEATEAKVVSSSPPEPPEQFKDPFQRSDSVKFLPNETSLQIGLVASSSATVSQITKPGKACLLGKELPFSLFGSDNEEEEPKSSEDLKLRGHSPKGDHQDNEVASEKNVPSCRLESQLSCAGSSVVICEITPDSVVLDQAPSTSPRCAESTRDNAKPAECSESPNCFAHIGISQSDVRYGKKMETLGVVSPELLPVAERMPHKRSRSPEINSKPVATKKPKSFDPECRTFIQDVVATHLQLRFGTHLPGKTIVSIQARVVDKILCNPTWTLQRLRKHKRDIDNLAERYAEKVRRSSHVPKRSPSSSDRAPVNRYN